ncbi:DNA polymerase family A-domain-containing protein [Polychytrium aggregatum]|uniref:DNA polymerase family A-domain-containing protein n=1 Tax=Polychytrium aggregatum TaxID=110093 RepID=UPI0022FF13FD|nr:DNA polymerase family A-domain-containing protein [Polychytrium aggregatum]KAI9208094.1 DNA polymerase family A-domain-containing protein [Polychytrium aggregatum]
MRSSLPLNDPEYRENQIGIQMLSKNLYEQLFPQRGPGASPDQVNFSRKLLKDFDLLGKTQAPLGEVKLELPKLLGSNIEDHFTILGLEQCHPYLDMATSFCSPKVAPPAYPKTWSQTPGWTRYNADGSAESVPYPDADAIVFDTEVLYKLSPLPVMAVALSETHWYSWTTADLFSRDKPFRDLIPLGQPDRPKVIIGHHVAFDRARIKEEYQVESTQYAFIDTLSLHCAVGGLSSQQRSTWMMSKKAELSFKEDPIQHEMFKLHQEKWIAHGSLNSLKATAELYLGKNIDKSTRDMFDTLNKEDIIQSFQECMRYCADDVLTTYELYRKLFPKFRLKAPHPVSFAGMLHMGKSYLTTTKEWKNYVISSEKKCREYRERVSEILMSRIQDAFHKEEIADVQDDPWLKHLDWTRKEHRITKRTDPNDPRLGRPKWFRDLYNTKTKTIQLSLSKRVVPYLLRLQWKGYPLYHSAGFGWLYRVPVREAGSIKTPPVTFSASADDKTYDPKAVEDSAHVYFRVPHKDGENVNCGNPLGKSYLPAFEEGTLTSNCPEALEILKLNAKCSYWISARRRVIDQFVVWQDGGEIDLGEIKSSNDQAVGVILPLAIAMGTVTRRAVEPMWMTAANASEKRIGSELKAMIRPPSGYKFIGADVDSQELWISSLLGDAQFGIHGATPIGFMTLQGAKALKTDLHSTTGAILGISRDHAKVFNYSRIYGASVHYAVQLLLQHNPGITKAEATEKAEALYKQTKGLTSKMIQPWNSKFFFGGSESHMFNALGSIAKSDEPRTPVLGCAIPDTLNPANVGNEYYRSRVNWAVQSSGVDYLHLLLVSIHYLFRRMGISGRFLLSIHDEVRFLVKEEDEVPASLALHISNLWVRALFASRVGIHDLPLSVSFFSCVDIDHCLRKEVYMNCVTPSNSAPIDVGFSLSIYQTLAQVEAWKQSRSIGSIYGDEVPTVARLEQAFLEEAKQLTGPAAPPAKRAAVQDLDWTFAQMLKSQREIGLLASLVGLGRHSPAIFEALEGPRQPGWDTESVLQDLLERSRAGSMRVLKHSAASRRGTFQGRKANGTLSPPAN